MSNAIESQIKERIQSFVSELDMLVRKSTLDAVRGALEGTRSPVRRGRPVGSGRGPGRPRGPAPEGVADSIVAHVKANDAQTVGDIVTAVGVKSAAVKKVIKDLLASGALKKTGAKRGTRYHVGSGRAPAKAKKAGKRRGRKAKRKAAARKPALRRKVVIPTRRRLGAAPKVARQSQGSGTDVPQSLAVG